MMPLSVIMPSIWGGAYDAVLRKAEFDESKHPRQPAGSERGGEFAPKDRGAAGSVPYGTPTGMHTFYGAPIYELTIRDWQRYIEQVLGYTTDERRIREVEEKIRNGEAVTHYYMARRPDGFLQTYEVNPYRWNTHGQWQVRSNGYGDLFFKNIDIYLHGEPKRPSQDNAYTEQWYDGDPEQAMQQGLAWEAAHQSELQKRFIKTAERKDPLWKMLGDYQYHPNKMSAGRIIRKINQDAFAHYHAQRTLDKLPFDADGYITLYRGGSPNGVSWSQSKRVAERFARYDGFGTVDARVSALVAIQSIRAGALDKEALIHERRFHRSQLLAAIDSSEQEVLVDPAVFESDS